jgi:hypothetical protein
VDAFSDVSVALVAVPTWVTLTRVFISASVAVNS